MKIVHKIIIIFSLIIISLMLIGIVIYKFKNKKNEEIVKQNNNIDKKEFVYFEDMNELGLYLAQKNGDWSKYDLSDNILNKYNEKDGIFGKLKFDNVEYKPYHNGKYPFEEYSYLVLTNGKKKTAYLFAIISKLDGFDIAIDTNNAIALTNELGEDIYVGCAINKSNFNTCLYNLAWGDEQEEMIGKTEHFKEKYPNFIDLFIHYSPSFFNKITFIEKGSNYDKKEGYFEVDSELECKIRTYKVKFILNKNGFIDDAESELIEEKSYESNGSNTKDKIFYKNSNWDKIKVTDEFRKKYTPEVGTFPDIDLISFHLDKDIEYDIGSKKIDNENQIVAYYFNDNHIHYYVERLIKNGKDIDDITYEKLDYIDMDTKEVKKLYLESKSN